MVTVLVALLFDEVVEPVVVAVAGGVEVTDVVTVMCVNPARVLTDWLIAARTDVELFHGSPPYCGGRSPR